MATYIKVKSPLTPPTIDVGRLMDCGSKTLGDFSGNLCEELS